MHGGTQTICFWAFGGYNMSTGGVKAHVAACGCKAGWFEIGLQGRQGMCGSLAAGGYPGRSIGLRCRFCEV